MFTGEAAVTYHFTDNFFITGKIKKKLYKYVGQYTVYPREKDTFQVIRLLHS